MSTTPKTLLVMAGGTGGHIFPALAVAKVLRSQGWRVVWLGNPDGMEARLVPEQDFECVWIKFGALRGKGLARKLLLPFTLLSGFWQARRALKRIKPDVVLGMGGYITFPGGMMASLAGIPLIVHEQNAVAGLANKVLAKVADRVLTGFPDVLPKGEWVGNPVRAEIAAVADKAPPAARYAERSGVRHILVVGGSLGAAALNTAVPQALALIAEEERPEVVHQAGEKHMKALRENYEVAGANGFLVPFITDMAGAYEWADLVVCRAGALTVAELAAAGVASVLVPFPHAVDDHQTANARHLADAGGAVLMPQDQLTPAALAELAAIPREQLAEMAAKARGVARTDAAERVAAICAEAAEKNV